MRIFTVTRFLSLLFVGMAAGGCALNDDRVAIENQLREQEQTIRELSDMLEESEQLLADQDRQLAVLRDDIHSSTRLVSASNADTEESKAAWGSVVDLQIHELTSGLVGQDGPEPVLNLVLQPLDSEGEVVKVSGGIVVRVSALSVEKPAREVFARKFTLTESRRLWTRGLVSTGFHIRLPLSSSQLNELQKTASGRILVEAGLDLGGERQYSGNAIIKVDVPE